MSGTGISVMIAAICVIWALASAILITAMLDRRGLTTPFPFIGLFLFRNLGRYREITRRETGKTGFLFYSFVVPINAALVLVLAALVLNSSAV
jgi:hypothetical protein